MNKYLIIILILFFFCNLINIEKFNELYLVNYSKLNFDNQIKLIIDNIKSIFEKNNFFSSKFKCDQLLLLLDAIIEDFNSILMKDCSLKNVKQYTDQSELSVIKTNLKKYILNEINFISNNYKQLIEIEITKFIDIIFNEYITNCSSL